MFWKVEAEGEAEGLNSPRAGVVLVDPGVLWEGGAVDGDEGQGQEVKATAVGWIEHPQSSTMWPRTLTVHGFFFKIVIPNIVRCIVTGSPLPSQKPPSFSLRRRGQSSPESTQGR